MEMVILLLSVPLFLAIVLLLSVFVLAEYSGNETTEGAPAKVNTPDTASAG